MAAGQAAARARALTWGILFTLAGCAVGPNFIPRGARGRAYRKDALPQAAASAQAYRPRRGFLKRRCSRTVVDAIRQ